MGEPVRGSDERWTFACFGESNAHTIRRLAELYLLPH
jgi:hypothetical protein